jgi:replicative superfamily II helicase
MKVFLRSDTAKEDRHGAAPRRIREKINKTSISSYRKQLLLALAQAAAENTFDGEHFIENTMYAHRTQLQLAQTHRLPAALRQRKERPWARRH